MQLACLFWRLLIGNKLPQLLSLFFPGRDKKGNLCACCVALKVIQSMCACAGRPPYLFTSCGEMTFVLSMAPLHVILQCAKSPHSHTRCHYSADHRHGWMIDGWREEGREQEEGRGHKADKSLPMGRNTPLFSWVGFTFEPVLVLVPRICTVTHQYLFLLPCFICNNYFSCRANWLNISLSCQDAPRPSVRQRKGRKKMVRVC